MIGSYYGRTKWFGGKKTVEGSVALFLSVFLGSVVLLSLDTFINSNSIYALNETVSFREVIVISCLSLCAMIIELTSPVNDNIAIPVGCMFLFLLLSFLYPF